MQIGQEHHQWLTKHSPEN